MPDLTLLATSAFGLEAIVSRELEALGYEPEIISTGRILFHGGPEAVARANLWLRSAARVLVRVATFPARDFDALFEGVKDLPWEDWVPEDGAFPVRGRSVKSQLSSVPACQRATKKAIAERLGDVYGRETLPETGPRYPVEIALRKDEATLTIDTTGPGLHKRGYRDLTKGAQLKETLAAALVQLTFWSRERPLIDPFCGTGTIPIEAAFIGRNRAPGLDRSFLADEWPQIPKEIWQRVRKEAREAILPPIESGLIQGYDIEDGMVRMARHHAERAGVSEDIHFQRRPFSEVSSNRSHGILIANPPYGERMSERPEVEALYRSMPIVFRSLPTWSHYVLTSHRGFERLVGREADRRRKLYNGQIKCTYYQFYGPPPEADRPSEPALEEVLEKDAKALLEGEGTGTGPEPAFGALSDRSYYEAKIFHNVLTKRARHLRRWPKRGITCYRLYERNAPEVPLVVDRYGDHLHIAEDERPHDRPPAEHEAWLELMGRTAAEVLELEPEHVHLKKRTGEPGGRLDEPIAEVGATVIVEEDEIEYQVNLTDYLDTGLRLHHRKSRSIIRKEADGKRFLSLFGYTGAFSVCAAAGGAVSTTTVGASETWQDWARENLARNGFSGGDHRLVTADPRIFLQRAGDEAFDLILVDPPSFSNRPGAPHWDVQSDHVELLNSALAHLTEEGTLYFTTTYLDLDLDEEGLEGELRIKDYTARTIPKDFDREEPHKIWQLKPDRYRSGESDSDSHE